MKNYTFHINGMHCKSCALIIESELKELPRIKNIRVSQKNNLLEVSGDFKDESQQDIADKLTEAVKKHGYSFSLEKNKAPKNWADFKFAVPAAAFFIALFFLLQKLGIVNLINGGNMAYGTAFFVGIIASLSTCMAVVGGLLLSLSATFAKYGQKTRPQIFFHIGRIVSFFFLGGIIGMAGSAFQLGQVGIFITGLIIGVVMLILGVNLLDIFGFTKKIMPTMPRALHNKITGLTNLNNAVAPAFIGIATFFLPCGFTQSMQIYSLSTGSFWGGALTMLSFALGTLPVLSLISFGSSGITNSARSGVFFKTAGLIVIAFALFNIINSLAAIGLIRPIFNF
jgi:sulfite exporter TauE/SafE/copper chaperone CopZ